MILKVFLIITIMLFSIIIIPQMSYGGSALSVEPNSENRVFITSENGGECNDIGNWIENSKTCVLTQDVDKYVRIKSSGITLDGNGHTIQLKSDKEKTTSMVVAVTASKVTIKNLIIKGTDTQKRTGLFSQANDVKITNSEFSGLDTGINFNSRGEISNNKIYSNNIGVNCTNCTITNNLISDNYIGMNLVTGNNVENNILKNNEYLGFEISYYGNIVSNNTIDGSGYPFHLKGQYTSTVKNNSFLNYQNGPLGDGKADGNYWDSFDSNSEGCIRSLTSNICNSSFVSGGIEDSTPWKIQNGWAYEFELPTDNQIITQNADGTSINFSISATGPEGSVGVTCSPSSDSLFPIGKTQVVCSTPNGVISSFFVTVLDENKIIQKQQQENTESGLIAFLKLSSLGLGIFLLILLFRARKRKNQKIKESSNNRTEQYHQYDNYQQEDYQQEYKSQTNSYTSQKSDSKDYDLYNLSKEDAFEILEVSESFTSQEIKTSRNRLINQWHPDKHKTPLYQNIAEKQTKLIITSYELLRELGYAD